MLLQDNQEDTIRDLIDQVLQICHITVNNLLKAKTTDILSNFFYIAAAGSRIERWGLARAWGVVCGIAMGAGSGVGVPFVKGK